MKPQWSPVNPASLPAYQLVVVGNGPGSAGTMPTAKPAGPAAAPGAGSGAAPTAKP